MLQVIQWGIVGVGNTWHCWCSKYTEVSLFFSVCLSIVGVGKEYDYCSFLSRYAGIVGVSNTMDCLVQTGDKPAPWELSIFTPIRTDSNAATLPYYTNALKIKTHGKLSCLSVCLFIALTDRYSVI